MPNYHYTARTKDGEKVRGQRQAASSQELAAQLLIEGLIPLDINQKSQALGSKKISISWFQAKISQTELQIFCRQMYTLLHAGIPLSQAIERLEETTRNKLFSEALKDLVVSLNKGNPLHVAMAKYPNIFSAFFY